MEITTDKGIWLELDVCIANDKAVICLPDSPADSESNAPSGEKGITLTLLPDEGLLVVHYDGHAVTTSHCDVEYNEICRVRIQSVSGKLRVYINGVLRVDVEELYINATTYRVVGEYIEYTEADKKIANPWDIYNFASPARRLLPTSLYNTYTVNVDYVRCGDIMSEAKHNLKHSAGSNVKIETVLSRYTGEWEKYYFSYDLKVVKGKNFAIRIDETGGVGNSIKDYLVLVNGIEVYHRIRKIHTGWQSGCWGGCAAYVIELDKSYTNDGYVNISFVRVNNDKESQPCIAAVWTLADIDKDIDMSEKSIGGYLTNKENVLKGRSFSLISHTIDEGCPYLVLDFGKSVSGILSFKYRCNDEEMLRISFSNSRLYAGIAGDTQMAEQPANDDSMLLTLKATGGAFSHWEHDTIRGAFRYINILKADKGKIDISDLCIYDAATAPAMEDMTAYPGYFYCNDEMLNKIWYSCAYTAQMCTSHSDYGNGGTSEYSLWASKAKIGPGLSCLTDAGKRDRWIWDADLAMAMPIAFLSIQDYDSTKNALMMCFDGMNEEGRLKDYSIEQYSEVYHVYGLYAFTEYYQYTKDLTFLSEYWDAFKKGMEYAISGLDNGLISFGGYSWNYCEDSYSTEISSLFYLTLINAALLAEQLNDEETFNIYIGISKEMYTAINEKLWDANKGAYIQSLTHSDHVSTSGCVMAILSGIADKERRDDCIKYIHGHMKNDFGYYTIDKEGSSLPKTNHVFCGSWLLKGFGEAGRCGLGMEYVLTTWGNMLNSPIGNNSTMWETYSTDGELSNEANDSVGHIWSCGPLQFLTEYILGVRLGSGNKYIIHPDLCDLSFAEGSVPTADGPIHVRCYNENGLYTIILDTSDYNEEILSVRLPGVNKNVKVSVNKECKIVYEDNYMYVSALKPGKYTIKTVLC